VADSTLESGLEGFFRKRVRLVGGYTVKLAPTEAGIPDRLVILPGGRMRLVELKTESGALSPIQRVLHSRLAELGVEVVVLYGRNAVIRWLREEFLAADPQSKRPRKPRAKVS
jgi:hypothetical protein